MAKRIIARVEEPKKGKSSLYRVWFSQDGAEYPADMNEKSYKVFLLEQEFEKAGIDMKKLQEYKEAVIEERDEDHKYDEED